MGKQDVRGRLEAALRELSRQSHDPELALVAGRLIEREQQRRAAARAAYPRAWKRLERRGRAWL